MSLPKPGQWHAVKRGNPGICHWVPNHTRRGKAICGYICHWSDWMAPIGGPWANCKRCVKAKERAKR